MYIFIKFWCLWKPFIVVIINLEVSMNEPMHFFSSFFMFLNTDFRMKTKIEMNRYEYANELIYIP